MAIKIDNIVHSKTKNNMDFGSEFIYAPEGDTPEYEYVEESRFNHTATGYSSVSADYKDDGEVNYIASTIYIIQDIMVFFLDMFVRYS